MSNYQIRLQLHQAPADAYPALHAAMAKYGCVRTIRGDNGVLYDLPWGEYRLQGSTLSIAQVLDGIRATVAAVWALSHLIITEEVSSAWVNLSIAKEDLNYNSLLSALGGL